MPQRFLRPGLRTSEKWNSVSRDAQALWLAILMVCDDYGRYDGRDSILCAEAFTVWNELNPKLAVIPLRIPALRSELVDKKLAKFYEFEGKPYVQIEQWQERARGASRWPDPEKSTPLRNPAESCGILPPSPLVIAMSHESSPIATPQAVGRFKEPTIEEVKLLAAKAGLPDTEAEKFFNFYAAKGWVIGKSKMKSPTHAIAGWKNRWQETAGVNRTKPSTGPARSEVYAYAKEKGDGNAVYACRWFLVWEKREWKNTQGHAIDWKIKFTEAFAQHRNKP